jgi:DNA-binding MarR family transcriptional regulator
VVTLIEDKVACQQAFWQDDSVRTFSLMLARLERLNEALLLRTCARHDLTPAELRVLAALDLSGRPALSPTTVAEWIVQTSGGLTATLRRLERRGLVERRPDPADGRGRLVAMTAEGRAVHDAAFADVDAAYAAITAELDLDEAAAAVGRLVDGLERSLGFPGASQRLAAALAGA